MGLKERATVTDHRALGDKTQRTPGKILDLIEITHGKTKETKHCSVQILISAS